MRLQRRELEGRAGAFGFRTVERWLARKTLVQAERLGERLGRIAFKTVRKRRELAIANLKLAFPDKPEGEVIQIAKGVFEHFGRVFCDFVRTATRSPQEVLDSITYEGLEHFDDALSGGKGFVFVTGHFGNWERMAQWISLKGYKMAVVVRDANNPDQNDLVLKLRLAAGVDVISRGSAARGVLTKLRKNEIAGILPDQNSGEPFIPFFGKPAGTVTGPAVLAQRAGCPIITGYCYRTGPGKYHAKISPPMTVPDGDDAINGTTALLNASLEAIVREFPDQYLWIHDRWKEARKRGLV